MIFLLIFPAFLLNLNNEPRRDHAIENAPTQFMANCREKPSKFYQ